MSKTTWKKGDAAAWVRFDSVGRIDFRKNVILASDPEPVRLARGGESLCVVTFCRRFVNIEALFPPNSEPAKRKLTKQKAPPKKKAKPGTRPTPQTTAKPAATPKPQKQPAEAKPMAADVPPCDVLAIDFLNLLVRAWHTGKVTEVHAVRSMFQTVANAVRVCRPRRVVFALDGGHKHRTALLPTYKTHRPPSDPNLSAQKELAEQAIETAGLCFVRIVDFEADDVLASIAEQCEDVVICSSDKDLLAKGNRARIYHPWKGGKFPASFVTSEDVLNLPHHQVTDYLALCGDNSDGIPGVNKVGPVTARKLLAEHGNLEAIMVAAIMGNIPGAVGKNLKANQAEAIKSRELVELRDSLRLPELHTWRPSSGWQNRLQDLKLGGVASVLESIADILQDRSEAASIQEPAESSRERAEPDQETPEALGWTAWRPSRSTAGDYLPVAWKLGQQARTKTGDDARCPFKPSTDTREFWQAGFDGRPLTSKAEWLAGQTEPAKPEVSEPRKQQQPEPAGLF